MPTVLKYCKFSYLSYFILSQQSFTICGFHKLSTSSNDEYSLFLLSDFFQYVKAAIHYAAEGGHLNRIQYLLENAVDRNVRITEVRKIS